VDNIRVLAKHNPVGIYAHGTDTDRRWQAGRVEEVREYLSAMRATGALVGLGTHLPEVIEYAEEQGWPVDFYMACLYNIMKTDHQSALAGGAQQEEPFDEEDRARMLATVRATPRPCLVFKVLGAGRRCRTARDVAEAFGEVLSGCKPQDALVVGMWQKHEDQLYANAQLVKKYLENGT
jgi:hypothetical protein